MPDESHNSFDTVRDVYTRVADAYAAHFLSELEGKPLDRSLLDIFVDAARGKGPVLDVATGSGQIARYLHDRGCPVTGLDLAPGMVAAAQRSHPDLSFRVGDMGALPDQSLGGITCFYGIVHLRRVDLPPLFREWQRVLTPGAPVLLSFHVGQETVRPPDFLGHTSELAWNFFTLSEVAEALMSVGLQVEIRVERRAYPSEHPSKRGYLLAKAPPSG